MGKVLQKCLLLLGTIWMCNLFCRCLSFANMGKEGDGRPTQGCQADQSCKEDKLPKETDNNNLLWVARVLELIYNDNK